VEHLNLQILDKAGNVCQGQTLAFTQFVNYRLKKFYSIEAKGKML